MLCYVMLWYVMLRDYCMGLFLYGELGMWGKVIVTGAIVTHLNVPYEPSLTDDPIKR